MDGLGVVGGGTGASNGLGGIRLQDINKCWIRNTYLTNFENQAVLVSAGGAGVFERLLITNALLGRAPGAAAGAFEIYGSDHLMDYIESTASLSIEGSVSDANLYCNAFLVRASNCFIRDCIGEISDNGWYISGYYNRFTACRADLNYGHGWFISDTNSLNLFNGCTANNNSQDTDNTYDAFHVDGTSGQQAQFINCLAWSSTSNKHRYGFYDQSSTASAHNRYIGCFSLSHGTATVYLSSSEFSPSYFEIPQSRRGTNFTNGDTTPSVAMHCIYDTANTNPTTITNFDDGIDGQIIRIRADTNTTITHGTNIFCTGGSNITCSANVIYSFQKRRGYWYQV